MEKFKKKLQNRIKILTLFTCLSMPVYLGLFIFKGTIAASDLTDFIRGFQLGIFLGLELVMMFFIRKYMTVLKNEEKIKKLYIQETDERYSMIAFKAHSIGWYIEIVSLALGTIIAGFYNTTIFFTLISVVAAILILKIPLFLFFSKKY